MSIFLGEYELTMDSKGRFMMPSGFRKQLPDDMEMRFVIKRGSEKFLSLYTIDGWNELNGKLSKMNDFNPKVEKFKRLFLNGASFVELDSAGRMLIAKPLQEYAGLKKELVFSAKGNKIEIWDKEAYYNYMNDFGDDLSDLSNEVFGADFMDPFQ